MIKYRFLIAFKLFIYIAFSKKKKSYLHNYLKLEEFPTLFYNCVQTLKNDLVCIYFYFFKTKLFIVSIYFFITI